MKSAPLAGGLALRAHLQLFVGKVDQKLLEGVRCERFEAEDVEEADEGLLATRLATARRSAAA